MLQGKVEFMNIGISSYSEYGRKAKEFLYRVDEAFYGAKTGRRDRSSV